MVVARDYYEVLGVARDATGEELQRAFRTLARRYHPDVNSDPSAEDRFKEINEAYHVLADPDMRSRYDRFGPNFRQISDDVASAGSGTRRAGGYRSATAAAGGRRRERGVGGVGIN